MKTMKKYFQPVTTDVPLMPDALMRITGPESTPDHVSGMGEADGGSDGEADGETDGETDGEADGAGESGPAAHPASISSASSRGRILFMGTSEGVRAKRAS